MSAVSTFSLETKPVIVGNACGSSRSVRGFGWTFSPCRFRYAYTRRLVDCRRCGQSNLEDSRFCRSCGASLDPAQLERRKTATLLFCDLVGSTALGERADAEAVRDFMAAYFARMREAIERHGGTVEKFIGDAVVGVFGVPVAHEDDALRAARASLEMRSASEDLGARAKETFGSGVSVRIGINTGRVVASVGGDQALVTGDAVNTAARLEQAAPPGEVLIGATTWRLTRDAVITEPAPPVVAKGKSKPVAAYRLVGLLPTQPEERARPGSTFVGRSDELERLQDVLGRCVERSRSEIVVIVGEAGVGKSRLVSEFLASTSGHARVARGRCLSYGSGATYWALAEAIRDATGIRDDDDPDEALAKLHKVMAASAAAVSHVARAIGLLDGTSSSSEIVWSVKQLFVALAEQEPLIVVIDDLHWAEPALIELLAEAAHAIEAAVLILVLARSEVLDRWTDASKVVHLEPLSASMTTDMVRGLLGDVTDVEIVDRLLASAQGNPLFVQELTERLIETGGYRAIRDDLDRRSEHRHDPDPADDRRPLGRPARRAYRGGAAPIGVWRGGRAGLPRGGGGRPARGRRRGARRRPASVDRARRPPAGGLRVRVRERVRVPPSADPRCGLPRRPEEGASGVARALRRLAVGHGRGPARRVRGDHRLPPGAGPSALGGIGPPR